MGKFWSCLLVILLLMFSGCNVDYSNKNNKSEFKKEIDFNLKLERENYINKIDSDTTLVDGNSLFYSKDDGATMEVFVRDNKQKEHLKIQEIYSNSGSISICSNTFYFKNGKKYISIELFEEGDEVTGNFIERISYYDQKERPIQTIQRKAKFEEQLELEKYIMVNKIDCSTKRAFMALNQEGEFATTFQGFISEGLELYLIVGDNEQNSFSSSLLVQYEDKNIKKLQVYEKEMIGKAIQVEFETLSGSQGYEYQILLSTSLR